MRHSNARLPIVLGQQPAKLCRELSIVSFSPSVFSTNLACGGLAQTPHNMLHIYILPVCMCMWNACVHQYACFHGYLYRIYIHCKPSLTILSFLLLCTQSVDKNSPSWEVGLRPGCLVTHLNGESITGLQHVQVVAILCDKKNTMITVSTLPLEQTSIRKDKRKRPPSLGHRVGKLFRHRSSGSGKIKKRPSFFNRLRKDRGPKGLDSSGHSSSSTPSPKLSSSPHRSDSFKERMRKMIKPAPRRKQTPVSPLARSTSPVPLSQKITPNSSPPGSAQNLCTPPNSPPTQSRRPERHSMFVDSKLLVHKKSYSACELTPPVPKKSSPNTSPLLKRAMSPSERKRFYTPKRSETLPRSAKTKSPASKAHVSRAHTHTASRSVYGRSEETEHDTTYL